MSNKRSVSFKYDSSTTEEEEMNDVSPRRSYRENAGRKQYQEKIIMDEEIITEPRRRVRGPSKRPCLNRNALMARENRQRKKEYVQKIENKLLFYQQENKNLANIIQKQAIDIKRLTGEVAYLRNVLQNNTAITALLKSINKGLRKRCTCVNNDTKPQGMGVTNTETLQEGNERSSKFKPESSTSYIGYHCTDSAGNLNYRQSVAKKTTNFFTENDHTYTAPKDLLGTNTEGQFEGKDVKPVNGLNGTHLMHSASMDCRDAKTVINKKIVTDTVKSEDGRSLTESTDLLKNTYSANYVNGKTRLTSMDKNLINSKAAKEKNNVLENTDSRNIINPQNTINENNLMDGENFVTASTMSSITSETVKDNTEQLGLDPLLPFNMDIFEDIPKCDDLLNSIDDLEDDPDLFTEGDLLQNLNNSGICLHVNSDKVSLEFCSVCHLNSTNSEID